MSKRTLKNIAKNLKKSSKVHAKQSKQIENIMKKSPTLKKKKFVPREMPLSEKEKKRLEERNKPKKVTRRKKGPDSPNIANATAKKTSPALAKLSASCKAAAKRKFKVYPSAYANMWAAKTQRQGKCQMYIQGNNPFKKKKTAKSITWKDSDAPDAKGKFKNLSPSSLASWLIKTRKGKLNRIIGSLNQQYVFNRGKKPSYAAKMKTTMNIVRKRLGKKKDE